MIRFCTLKKQNAEIRCFKIFSVSGSENRMIKFGPSRPGYLIRKFHIQKLSFYYGRFKAFIASRSNEIEQNLGTK